MQQIIVRFIARSGAYLGLPKKVIAAVIDELLEREWAKLEPVVPVAARPLRPELPFEHSRA